MSIQRDALNELKNIAQDCREMLNKLSNEYIPETEVMDFLYRIMNNASDEYINGARELGWDLEDYE